MEQREGGGSTSREGDEAAACRFMMRIKHTVHTNKYDDGAGSGSEVGSLRSRRVVSCKLTILMTDSKL